MYKIIGADGNQYGPVTLEELMGWIRDNRANADTQVQGPDMSDWRPLKAFPEFAAALAAPPVAQPAPGPTPFQGAQVPVQVNDYLVPAILVTLCCCLPFGIVAIVYAAQANSKKSVGDYLGAQDAASKAKTWTWVALISGAVVTLLYVGLIAIAELAK